MIWSCLWLSEYQTKDCLTLTYEHPESHGYISIYFPQLLREVPLPQQTFCATVSCSNSKWPPAWHKERGTVPQSHACSSTVTWGGRKAEWLAFALSFHTAKK